MSNLQTTTGPRNETPSELHLFILWSSAREYEEEILSDLRATFRIITMQHVKWMDNDFLANLNRFYGAEFTEQSKDLRRRGKGAFRLITILDDTPRYELQMTSRGHNWVNVNLLEAKNRYRTLVGNEFAIHSTVTVPETKHDILLLTGKTYEEHLQTMAETDQNIEAISERGLLGAPRWFSLDEVFKVLNETTQYVLLRDYAGSPQTLGKTSDIDLLVDDIGLETVPQILDGKLRKDDTYGTWMCDVIVGNELIPFHLHSFSYLTPRWALDILKTRIVNKSGLFVPVAEHQFYSLFYQLLHCKLIVKEKHKNDLSQLYQKLFASSNGPDPGFDGYLTLLDAFLCTKGYRPAGKGHVRDDPREVTEIVRQNIESFDVKEISPYRTDLWKPNPGGKFFTGIYSGKKVFIKYFGVFEVLHKEYKVMKFLHAIHPSMVPKPLFYRNMRAGHQVLITEFVDSKPISKELLQNLSATKMPFVVTELLAFVRSLISHGFVHRDLDPSNILISSKGKVTIIDYEFLVDTTETLGVDSSDCYRSYETLCALGVPNNFGKLKWNDAHSVLSILHTFLPDVKSRYINEIEELESIAKTSRATYKLKVTNPMIAKKYIKYQISRAISISMRIIRKYGLI